MDCFIPHKLATHVVFCTYVSANVLLKCVRKLSTDLRKLGWPGFWLFGIGFDPCGALLEGAEYPFGRGGAAGSLEAIAMSMILSCPHPPRYVLRQSSRDRVVVLFGGFVASGCLG
jgi:hypothetical protein